MMDHLIQALGVTSEEAELIQIMTIGQRNNPLWMDARQWQITTGEGDHTFCLRTIHIQMLIYFACFVLIRGQNGLTTTIWCQRGALS